MVAGEALLAGGADDEVAGWNLGVVEVGGEVGGGDFCEAGGDAGRGGVGDFLLAAVVKTETGGEAGAVCGGFFSFAENFEKVGGDSLGGAENNTFDVILGHFGGEFRDAFFGELHEVGDFVGGTRPVFGAEEVERSELEVGLL